MSNFDNEKILYVEPDVVIAEVSLNFWGTKVGKVVWNGKGHTAVIGETRLMFLPDDKNGKIKSWLAQRSMELAHFTFGTPSMGRVAKMFLANEGFDIFGSRQISFHYFPVNLSNPEVTIIADCVLNNILIRKKYDNWDTVNDFLDLPAPQIALRFESHDRAVAFANALEQAQDAWRAK